jgi:hypothetical protein
MWSSPLKEPKKTKSSVQSEKPAELEKFPVVKCKIKSSTAKKTLGVGGVPVAQWLERWIEQFVRESSLPPQLLSNDFLNQLTRLLAPKDALNVLERIRSDYLLAFPQTSKAEKEDLDWLGPVIRMDATVVSSLPSQYL